MTWKNTAVPAKKVPYTKRDVQKLRKEQRGLADYQDQKIDGLVAQVKKMDDTFEIARQKREALKKLYKERREEVLRQIAETRSEIDAHFVRLHKHLKDFSVRWLNDMAVAIKEWEDALERHSEDIEKQLVKVCVLVKR